MPSGIKRITPTSVVVTGGSGFIGSAFIHRMLSRKSLSIVNVDVGTYAADAKRLQVAGKACNTRKIDIASDGFGDALHDARPELLVHFAAETHVTRGESQPESFYRTNVEGTRRVLECAETLSVHLVVHVSTDEVYGPCFGSPFKEDEKARGEGLATSAYARSKAMGDDLAQSFLGRLPLIIVRPTNCFGPWQHPEKAIPRWITRALQGRPLPVWGDGRQIRDWMHVGDACSGLETLIERGTVGEVYNLAPQQPQESNLSIAEAIARSAGAPSDSVYLTAYDRPHHDRRYAVNADKLRALGWKPLATIESGIRSTVEWYRQNREWWEPLIPEAENLYGDEEARTT